MTDGTSKPTDTVTENEPAQTEAAHQDKIVASTEPGTHSVEHESSDPALEVKPAQDKANKPPTDQDEPASTENKPGEISTGEAKVEEAVDEQANLEESGSGEADSKEEKSEKENQEEKAGQENKKEKAKKTKKKPEPQEATPEQIGELEEEIKKLSAKNTAELFTVRNKLNRLRKVINEEHELNERASKLHLSIVSMVEENQAHQEELHEITSKLIEALQKSLDDGQSQGALPAWDRIQGNISNTSGKIRNTLQESSNPFKARINELRDWKVFAATEKKRELVQEMEKLSKTQSENEIGPQELNKKISKLHNEWKALGRSNDNEKLWKEFKTFSDKAYAPCKEFFKQRKNAMTENLKRRRELCDELEKELATIDPENIHVGNINKLLNHTESEWKKHAPVEQSKIKTLQKRYYGLINQFRKFRRNSARQHANEKQALIEQAKALINSEDKREAMEAAKLLQKKWKEIGPVSFKDDKKYWAEFRSACDSIFEHQGPRKESGKADKQHRGAQQESDGEIKAVLQTLEQILDYGEEKFREAKQDYQAAAQRFNSMVTGKLRHSRSRQIEHFKELKRKIDMRFQALPDKKTQALIEGLRALDATLCESEDLVLNSKDDGDLSAAAKVADQLMKDASFTLPDKRHQELLQTRTQALQSKSIAKFTDIGENSSNALRTLCVSSEIRAGIDSAEEDQALRMQLQLAQLQDGFGQSRPDSKENLSYVRSATLEQYCLGPVPKDQREALRTRLAHALTKIVS